MSKKAQGNIYAIVDGKKFDLTRLREIMGKNKLKYTLRQWARTNANLMATAKICSHFDIAGDLAKKIYRDHRDLEDESKYWLSNFQMDNPTCPQELRNLLKAHYKNLFPDKGSTFVKKQIYKNFKIVRH
jgi:hypothetical protein